MPVGTTQQQITRESIAQALRFPAVYRTYQQLYAEPPSAAMLEQRQADRLASLLSRVLTEVPAFRELGMRWSDGMDPFAVQAGLPTMTKADLLANPADHVSDDLDPARCVAVVTSGTTGQPLRIIHSEEHLIHAGAAELARQLASGLPFDRRTLLPFMAGAGLWREYTVVNTGFSHTAEFGFLEDVDAATRLEVARRCAAFRPDALVSHPPRLAAFADLLDEAGIKLSVPMVQTFGVTLTEAVRARLREAFTADVRDQYGLNEVNLLAAECPDGRMHIDANRLFVEILDQDGRPVPDSSPGEVVVTNFFNAVMPFIRYRTGDIAAVSSSPCSCGQVMPVLSLLAGRDHGAIRFRDGTSIDGLRVVRALERLPLRQLQVIQRDLHTLIVLATPLPGRDSADRGWSEQVAVAARASVGDRIGIEVRAAEAADYHRPRGDKVAGFVSLIDRRPSPSVTR